MGPGIFEPEGRMKKRYKTLLRFFVATTTRRHKGTQRKTFDYPFGPRIKGIETDSWDFMFGKRFIFLLKNVVEKQHHSPFMLNSFQHLLLMIQNASFSF